MKGWLQAVFAILVIAGWFIFALWVVLSVIQIGVVQSTGGCVIAADLEVSCVPHA